MSADRIYIKTRDEPNPLPEDAPAPGEYQDAPQEFDGRFWEATCFDCHRLILGCGERYTQPYRCPDCYESVFCPQCDREFLCDLDELGSPSEWGLCEDCERQQYDADVSMLMPALDGVQP